MNDKKKRNNLINFFTMQSENLVGFDVSYEISTARF